MTLRCVFFQSHDPSVFGSRNKHAARSFSTMCLHIITLNQGLNSPCRKKNHSPIPLEYIGVVRRTKTTSDVLLERRIDGFWNIDSDRNLSEPWTGITQFTRLNEKPPDGCGVRGEAADKTIGNDKLVWNVTSSSTKRKAAVGYRKAEARQCAKFERHSLIFITTDDMVSKDTIKNARNKLGSSLESAMPCKDQNLGNGETCGEIKSNTRNSTYACIVEAHESTRKRLGKNST